MRHDKIRFLFLAILFLCGSLKASGRWLYYDNGVHNSYFCFYGPQRAVCLNPRDFGVTYPTRIDSLGVMFCTAMNSFTDSVFTFIIYGNDGSSLLYRSESLIGKREPIWTSTSVRSPVRIDSGNFYVTVDSRTISPPYAYPYITADNNNSPVHSFYGQPGNWQGWTYGEIYIRAFVTWPSSIVENRGQSNNEPSLKASAQPNPFRGATTISLKIVNQTARKPPHLSIDIYDVSGRPVKSFILKSPASLESFDVVWNGKDNYGRELPAGVYILRLSGKNRMTSKLIKVE